MPHLSPKDLPHDTITGSPCGAGASSCATETREVLVHGHRMRYFIAGSGAPVLLLHGLADSKEAWLRVAPELARRYQVVAPDLLGCGDSDKPDVSYHPVALATYLRHFLDALHIPSAHVVGHSLGGGLALHLYMRYPERVESLALVASGGFGRQLPLSMRLCTLAGSSGIIGALLASRHSRHPAARIGHALLSRLWPATSVADLAGRTGADTTRQAQAVEEADILDRLRDRGARSAFLAMLRSVGDIRGQRTSALGALRLVQVPVLLINGRDDTVIPVAHGVAALRHLTDGRLEVLDNCGHCPHREAPSRVAALLRGFFARVPSARMTVCI